MPYKKFLEDYPLFKKCHMFIPDSFGKLKKPSINKYCKRCRTIQTFNATTEYLDETGKVHLYAVAPKGHLSSIAYQCAGCNLSLYNFYLLFSPENEYIIKVGQYPPWEINTDSELSKLLGEHVEYYKRGLVCESQSYGLAALAYYRRIVEDIIDLLLESIEELIEDKDKARYKVALLKTRATTVTKDKIELVKDLLPSSLRPNNINPLNVIHSSLSEGLHSKNEDECLEIAGGLKESIIFLVNQILQTKQHAMKFSDGMKKFLEKKSKGF
jgi:hypothetical protein